MSDQAREAELEARIRRLRSSPPEGLRARVLEAAGRSVRPARGWLRPAWLAAACLLLAITDASLWWRSRVSVEPAVATTRQRALLSRELGLDVDDPLLGRYALDTHCALPGLAESDIRAPGGGL